MATRDETTNPVTNEMDPANAGRTDQAGDAAGARYTPKDIEPKWQRYWEQHRTFRAERHAGRPKLYVLDMFPYPSGSGLHVGHPEGYTATDIVSRHLRMKGVNVLHPMGWDAFC